MREECFFIMLFPCVEYFLALKEVLLMLIVKFLLRLVLILQLVECDFEGNRASCSS
jgi:hypothetical protein